MTTARTIRDSLPVHPAPALDQATHHLRIDGLVARPCALSAADLAALPHVDLIDEFTCLEGWAVPGVRWQGVPLRALLQHVGAHADASWVQITADGFSVPLPRADAERALLATMLNGEPLPLVHGGPARLVLPGGECFTSVKWVSHIDLRAAPAENSARTIAMRRIGLDPDAADARADGAD